MAGDREGIGECFSAANGTQTDNHALPLGLHRLMKQVSTVAETSKQKTAVKRNASRAAALQEE